MNRLLVYGLVLFNLACQSAGTGTGNPLQNSADSVKSADLTGAICRKLTACHTGLQPGVCYNSVFSHTGLPAAFGLTSGYANLNEVHQAETAKILVADTAAYNACVVSIQDLACSAPEVQSAYQPMAADPWSNLPPMIPAVCAQVYPP